MDKSVIKRLAHQTGIAIPVGPKGDDDYLWSNIEKFAEAIAAHERSRCAREAELLDSEPVSGRSIGEMTRGIKD